MLELRSWGPPDFGGVAAWLHWGIGGQGKETGEAVDVLTLPPEPGAADHAQAGPLQHRQAEILLLLQWGEGVLGRGGGSSYTPVSPLFPSPLPGFPPHLRIFSYHASHPLLHTALQKDELYLNLVLEYVPETVYRVARHFTKAKLTIPIIYVKVGGLAASGAPQLPSCLFVLGLHPVVLGACFWKPLGTLWAAGD